MPDKDSFFSSRGQYSVLFELPKACVRFPRKKKGPEALHRFRADNVWWRRGESNSGPYYILPEALQAYSVVGFKAAAVHGQTLTARIGSVLAGAIPITCPRRSPLK